MAVLISFRVHLEGELRPLRLICQRPISPPPLPPVRLQPRATRANDHTWSALR